MAKLTEADVRKIPCLRWQILRVRCETPRLHR